MKHTIITIIILAAITATQAAPAKPIVNCEALRALCLIEKKPGCIQAKMTAAQAAALTSLYKAFCAPTTPNQQNVGRSMAPIISMFLEG